MVVQSSGLSVRWMGDSCSVQHAADMSILFPFAGIRRGEKDSGMWQTSRGTMAASEGGVSELELLIIL